MGYDTGSMEPTTASREELIDLVTEQQAVIEVQRAAIERLEARVAELEAGSGKPKGLAGNKLEPSRPDKPKEPRKKRDRNFVRRRTQHPDERVAHAYEACPVCGTGLGGGSVKRTREVIEVSFSPATVTEHAYIERLCPICEKRRTPKAQLRGVAGKSRLGVGLQSLIAVLRQEARLPIDTICWYLSTFHSLSLSAGAIVGALRSVAGRGQAEVARILAGVRASPVVLADETGWREDGVNGYVWTYSTPKERYFLRAGRDSGVVRQVLGEEFEGVLVSDFYSSYNCYLGEHQRCWAHLLRDIHELVERHPGNQGAELWAHSVGKCYEDAREWLDKHPDESEQTRLRARLILEDRLLALCKPYLAHEDAPQAVLCRRIERYIKELFVFVSDKDVPPDNNGAERSLRPLVTQRKIGGGTRSVAGTHTQMTLASLFGTWRARALNPYHSCLALLDST